MVGTSFKGPNECEKLFEVPVGNALAELVLLRVRVDDLVPQRAQRHVGSLEMFKCATMVSDFKWNMNLGRCGNDIMGLGTLV